MDELTDSEIEDLVFGEYALSSDIDLMKVPEPERSFVAIYCAQGIIDNGGLRYFFESDFPTVDAYTIILQSYRNIGFPKLAEALEKVFTLFPNSLPHLNLYKRALFLEEYFSEFSEKCHPTVNWAESMFFKQSESVYRSAVVLYRREALNNEREKVE